MLALRLDQHAVFASTATGMFSCRPSTAMPCRSPPRRRQGIPAAALKPSRPSRTGLHSRRRVLRPKKVLAAFILTTVAYDIRRDITLTDVQALAYSRTDSPKLCLIVLSEIRLLYFLTIACCSPISRSMKLLYSSRFRTATSRT